MIVSYYHIMIHKNLHPEDQPRQAGEGEPGAACWVWATFLFLFLSTLGEKFIQFFLFLIPPSLSNWSTTNIDQWGILLCQPWSHIPCPNPPNSPKSINLIINTKVSFYHLIDQTIFDIITGPTNFQARMCLNLPAKYDNWRLKQFYMSTISI